MTRTPDPKSRAANWRLAVVAGRWSSVIRRWSFNVGLPLLAFALRLYRLDGQSIWVDEGISLHLATSSLAEITANRAANIHPPLYFFCLKAWVALVGTSMFSARYLSALASLLQVAAVYGVARRWLGEPAARVAALLTALSPLSVVYAQEARAYALLPLVYLALVGVTHELIHRPGPRRRATWILLGTVEVLGLYLHYTALFLVAYVGGWTLIAFWKGKRWSDLRRWAITQSLAALAGLPWLIAVLTHWPAVQARLEAGWGLTESIPLDYLLRQVWVFHLTGLTQAVRYAGLQWLAALILLLLSALLLLRLRQPSNRRTATCLTAHWLIPLGTALLVWAVRSFSHPRYIALFAPGLTLLAAYAICPPNLKSQVSGLKRGHLSSAISATLAISLMLISLLGLRAYFFDPAFAKDDVDGVARYLEEVAGPDDLILIPDSDWSLTFAYQGDASFEMPSLADERQLWTDLTRWTTERRRVFLTDYRREARDWRDIVFFSLENAGTRTARQDFRGLSIYLYELDRPVEPPTLAPLGARFSPLTLTHGWTEREAPADTALTLALRWHLEQTTDQRYRLTIRLLDEDGWSLAARDAPLLDGQIRPTTRWRAGQETTTYHILPIPPDVPPLTYTLALGLYAQTDSGPHPLELLDSRGTPQGQYLDLATVRLSNRLGLADRPYQTSSDPPPLPRPAELTDGLQLLGAALDRAVLSPGQPLFVTLRWQATDSSLPDLRPRLALVQAGQELVADDDAPALGRYPTDRWQAGETVVEHRRLVAPSTAAQGPADVMLTLGDERLVLGQVEIQTHGHIFTPPPISYPLNVRFGQVGRLLGYDLPSQTFYAGEPVTLTLYWEALEGAADADYAVFTHILAIDGQLVGQHDGPPAGGARPTAGWVPGEIITDPHAMTFREPYAGPARIEVGLYDPATMERVTVEGGETFVLLPATLTILER